MITMAKDLPTSYLLFLLLAFVSVELMVIKVNANTHFDTLGSCLGEAAWWQASTKQQHSQGYCEYDTKPGLPRVCAYQYAQIEMLPLRVIVEEESEDGYKYCNTHFVLVHGSGGGAWNWFKVRTLLENYGYKVSCLDLKSAGMDETNLSSILTFEDYNKPLVDFLSTLPENEKVILVGHSAGGVSVTDAIHRFGKKISIAVYIGATMLRRGFLTEQDKIDGIPNILGQPSTNSTMSREFLRKIMYNLSPEEDATLSWMLHKDGPVKVISEAKFGESLMIDEVPRLYIKTMHDQVLKPEQQDAMIKKWPPSVVFLLESDHNPIFSTPSDLVGMLIKVASSIKIFTGTCT